MNYAAHLERSRELRDGHLRTLMRLRDDLSASLIDPAKQGEFADQAMDENEMARERIRAIDAQLSFLDMMGVG